MTLGGFILKRQRDHPLVCKRSRRVIGLNGAPVCFFFFFKLFLNVRASLGEGGKHTGFSRLFDSQFLKPHYFFSFYMANYKVRESQLRKHEEQKMKGKTIRSSINIALDTAGGHFLLTFFPCTEHFRL